MREPWFGARRYGYGVTPLRWQGWAVVGVFLAALIGWAQWAPAHGRWLFGAGEIAGVAALLWITQATDDGQPWRWRWATTRAAPDAPQ